MFNALITILETLYTAYFAIGILAYLMALLSHLPFIMSLMRMLYRDSENRRRVFYRNCYKLWLFALAIDLFVFFNLEPSVDETCEITGHLPDEKQVAQHFNVSQIS